MRDENRRCAQCASFESLGAAGDPTGRCHAQPPGADAREGWPPVYDRDWCSTWEPAVPEQPPAYAVVAAEVSRRLTGDSDALARALQTVIAGEARRIAGQMCRTQGDERYLSTTGEDILDEQLIEPEADTNPWPRWRENAEKLVELLNAHDRR